MRHRLKSGSLLLLGCLLVGILILQSGCKREVRLSRGSPSPHSSLSSPDKLTEALSKDLLQKLRETGKLLPIRVIAKASYREALETLYEKVPKGATEDERDRVKDLRVQFIDKNGGATNGGLGEVTLSWTERLTGDFNYDGLISANDLSPIALNFSQATYSDPSNIQIRDIDSAGNLDNIVNAGDLSPIAFKFATETSGYVLFRAPDDGSPSPVWERVYNPLAPADDSVPTVWREDAIQSGKRIGDSDPNWRLDPKDPYPKYQFTDEPPVRGKYRYIVRPFSKSAYQAGGQYLGIESNQAAASTELQPSPLRWRDPNFAGIQAVVERDRRIIVEFDEAIDPDGGEVVYDVYYDDDPVYPVAPGTTPNPPPLAPDATESEVRAWMDRAVAPVESSWVPVKNPDGSFVDPNDPRVQALNPNRTDDEIPLQKLAPVSNGTQLVQGNSDDPYDPLNPGDPGFLKIYSGYITRGNSPLKKGDISAWISQIKMPAAIKNSAEARVNSAIATPDGRVIVDPDSQTMNPKEGTISPEGIMLHSGNLINRWGSYTYEYYWPYFSPNSPPYRNTVTVPDSIVSFGPEDQTGVTEPNLRQGVTYYFVVVGRKAQDSSFTTPIAGSTELPSPVTVGPGTMLPATPARFASIDRYFIFFKSGGPYPVAASPDNVFTLAAPRQPDGGPEVYLYIWINGWEEGSQIHPAGKNARVDKLAFGPSGFPSVGFNWVPNINEGYDYISEYNGADWSLTDYRDVQAFIPDSGAVSSFIYDQGDDLYVFSGWSEGSGLFSPRGLLVARRENMVWREIWRGPFASDYRDRWMYPPYRRANGQIVALMDLMVSETEKKREVQLVEIEGDTVTGKVLDPDHPDQKGRYFDGMYPIAPSSSAVIFDERPSYIYFPYIESKETITLFDITTLPSGYDSVFAGFEPPRGRGTLGFLLYSSPTEAVGTLRQGIWTLDVFPAGWDLRYGTFVQSTGELEFVAYREDIASTAIVFSQY